MQKSTFTALAVLAQLFAAAAAWAQPEEPPPTEAPAPETPPPAEAPPVEAKPEAEKEQAPAAEAPATAAAPAPAEAAAEEPKKKPLPEISGHIESAYHLSLSHPEAEDPVALRSYDAIGGNSFLLHSAHLVVKHAMTDKVSATIELDGGTDANLGNGGVGLFDVQEAYATYTSPFGLYFTAGKFVTYEGIEVIEGPANPTITRGYLFGLAEAFTHIGAKLHYKAGDVADIGVGVVNGWDLYVDNNDAKTGIFRVGLTPVKQFWIAFSGSYGAERADSNNDRRLSLDATGAVVPSDMITFNFQANYGQEPNVPLAAPAVGTVDGSWMGFGLQPVLKVDAFSFGARFEYFADKEGTRTGAPGTDVKVWNVTATPGYTIDEALQLRAEYRLDGANEEIFNGEDKQHTVAAAVSYLF